MRLNKTEREELRKRVQILIPQMEKSEIVNHFKKEGFPRNLCYGSIYRMQLGGTIDETGRPTSQTPTRKNQLKKLTNNDESKTSWS